jgi:OOP family OmpA-OmpF porin
MQISRTQRALVVASALLLGACATGSAPTGTPNPYVTDTRNAIVKDPFNLCWRTGFWTPALANCECDKDLLPKEKCEPPAPRVAPPPPPAPAPKPAVVPPKPTTEKVTLSADVLFDFDKAVIRPDGSKALDDLAARAKATTLEVIIAIGHTDPIGALGHNQKLSVRRAEAVKAYLVSKGIEPNRIYTEGKGPKQLVKQCKRSDFKSWADYVACNQPNRRVEVEIVGTRSVNK